MHGAAVYALFRVVLLDKKWKHIILLNIFQMKTLTKKEILQCRTGLNCQFS